MEGKTETIVTNINGELFYESIKKLTENWSNLPLPVRYLPHTYIFGAFLCSFLFAYYSGRDSLLQHRRTDKSTTTPSTTSTDHYEAMKGIKTDAALNTWRSLSWPFHLASTTMSSLVIYLNPIESTAPATSTTFFSQAESQSIQTETPLYASNEQ